MRKKGVGEQKVAKSRVRLGDGVYCTLLAIMLGIFHNKVFQTGYSLFFRKGCECSLPRKRLSENPWECEWMGGFEAGYLHSSFPGGEVVKNLPADAGDAGSIPGWGRSPGGGHGNTP